MRIVLVLRLSLPSFPLMYGNPTKWDFASWYLDTSSSSPPQWERFLAELGFFPVSLHKKLRIRRTQLLTYLAHVFHVSFKKEIIIMKILRYHMPLFPLQNTSCCQYFHSLSLTVTNGNEHKPWKHSLAFSGFSPNLNTACLTWTHMEHLLPLN